MAMSGLRILIAEDHARWQGILRESLAGLDANVHFDVAASYQQARLLINNNAYDLATIDLSLVDDPSVAHEPNERGFDLLEQLRASPANRHRCALIVVSGRGAARKVSQAYARYNVDSYVYKADFGEPDTDLLTIARTAIRNAQLRYAKHRRSSCVRLTISCEENQFVGSRLHGPRSDDMPARGSFAGTALITKTDLLNTLLRDHAAWRQAAHQIGDEMYQILAGERTVFQHLLTARGIAEQSSDLRLQFSSSSAGLGLPFELLRDRQGPYVLDHVVTRHLQASFSHKTKAFHEVIEELVQQQMQLKVLVVGADGGNPQTKAEEEASELARTIALDLHKIAIDAEVQLLVGRDASYDAVKDALRQGGFHIFHYAGHGRHAPALPENSGLLLPGAAEELTLTAGTLRTLIHNTRLELAYLSCCLGARTAAEGARGDFHGVMEAIARADVPVVLGYRWDVAARIAKELALSFYHHLWRSFSPGEALLEARQNASTGDLGRDDPTWAAQVLLDQNM
jgi:CheY-like chemotaxis protein